MWVAKVICRVYQISVGLSASSSSFALCGWINVEEKCLFVVNGNLSNHSWITWIPRASLYYLDKDYQFQCHFSICSCLCSCCCCINVDYTSIDDSFLSSLRISTHLVCLIWIKVRAAAAAAAASCAPLL